MTNNIVDLFTQQLAELYDERTQNLAPINEALYFLMSLILKKMPSTAKVLCIGAGTGAEIIAMAKIYPNWSFVAVEPSLSMLNVCRVRLQTAGILERCDLIHGYVSDAPQIEFNAVFSIFVAHFIKAEERLSFFKEMFHRLQPGGYFVNAEISYDLHSEQFPPMLKNWEIIQRLMGSSPESIANLPKQLKEVLSVLPPQEVEALIRESGIQLPIKFYQAFLISAWYGVK